MTSETQNFDISSTPQSHGDDGAPHAPPPIAAPAATDTIADHVDVTVPESPVPSDAPQFAELQQFAERRAREDAPAPGGSAASDSAEQKMDELRDIIKKLEENLAKINQEMLELRANGLRANGIRQNKFDEEEVLKPLTTKDVKPPGEYGGLRKDFLSWHESFKTFLTCRSAKWRHLIEWVKQQKEKRIKSIEQVKGAMEWEKGRGRGKQGERCNP